MVDFKQVKESVSVEQALSFLGIQIASGGNAQKPKVRCPHCDSVALAVNTDKNVWFCQSAKVGGSVIDLVAHIKDIPAKDAAQFLEDHAGRPAKPSKPAQDERAGFKALDYLEHDHPAVEVIGFDVEIAKKLGIGYAAKGILRGNVAIPIRDEKGTLIAYIGVQEAVLPPSLRGVNVVELKQA